MSNEILIELNQVGKRFCKNLKRSLAYGVRDIARELFLMSQDRSTLRTSEFWALSDVSLQVRRGECVGLLGRNGAGKTTLLRVLNGLIKPDRGSVTMRGRVGAMIALGAGFNPILTGRENIFVNATVLGLRRREVEDRIDDIIEFAELGDFIDSPVRSYSSGMQVRLGFAIATALKPDVLLLDEVLAVGDARFRSKCYNRIGALIKDTAVVYVGHDMNQIGRLCDRTVVMRQGRCVFDGPPSEGIVCYMDVQEGDITSPNPAGCISFLPGLEIHSIKLLPDVIDAGERVVVQIDYSSVATAKIGSLRCNFVDRLNQLAADYDSELAKQVMSFLPGRHVVKVDLGRLPLPAGEYYLNLAAFDECGHETLAHSVYIARLVVRCPLVTSAPMLMGISD